MADEEMGDADLVRDDSQQMETGQNDPEDKDEGSDAEEESVADTSEEEEEEAYLATTRQRRANAGNRMSRLIELAEAEDEAQEEYAEIFQEQANDEEFEEADDEGDVSLSSSDEEETGAEQDEEQGERELQRQERQENQRKRKRETLIQQMMKKKAARAGIPPPASSITPIATEVSPRLKKKSERVSWIPQGDDGALRASSRKLAIENKQATHQRLKEKEKHRLRTVAIMKAAEQRKEANKRKILTQADRLAEAARIERQNSKTVHRWEEAEKKKAEEQKAKLAALKNRKLEGPVIGFYSGPALWVNDKLRLVGKQALVENILHDGVRQSASAERSFSEVGAPSAAREANSPQTPSTPQTPQTAQTSQPVSELVAYSVGETPALNDVAQEKAPIPDTTLESPKSPRLPPEAKSDFWQGVHFYASLAKQEDSPRAATSDVPVLTLEEQSQSVIPRATSPAVQSTPASQPEKSTQQQQAQEHDKRTPPEHSQPEQSQPEQPQPEQSQPKHSQPEHSQPYRSQPYRSQPDRCQRGQSQGPPRAIDQHQPAAPAPPSTLAPPPAAQPPPPAPPRKELSARTLISLRSFDLQPAPPATAAPAASAGGRPSKLDARDPLIRALLSAPDFRSGKLAPRKRTACSVTDAPARYRDPVTGLPYADVAALKALRRLADDGCVWSALLGAYVGGRARAPAKGVPVGFSGGGKEDGLGKGKEEGR